LQFLENYALKKIEPVAITDSIYSGHIFQDLMSVISEIADKIQVAKTNYKPDEG